MEPALNVYHDLQPEELAKFLTLSQETNKPINQLILEAARKLAVHHQADSDKAKSSVMKS